MNESQILVLVVAAILAFLLLRRRFSSNKEVQSMVAEGAKIVDVRTPGEFATGHYPGAVNIPLDSLSNRIREFGKDLAAPIVVYCASGGRSGGARRILESAGFTNVVNGGGLSSMMRLR
jgi:phage shock protein E